MKTTVKKLLKFFIWLLLLLVFLAAGTYLFHQNYAVLNGKILRRDIETVSFYGEKLPDLDTLAELKQLQSLDLRGTGLTLGEHEWLQRQLPQCHIQWQISFQGQLYSPETEEIVLKSLEEEDLIMLTYLPALTFMDARCCKDPELLQKLAEDRKECRILYDLELGDRIYNQDTKEVLLSGEELDQLMQLLPLLPGLEKIEFKEPLPTIQQLNLLQEACPQAELDWQKEVYGALYSKNQETFDLSAREVDVPELVKTLLYFPYVRILDLRGVLLSPADRTLLETRYPQVEMLTSYNLAGLSLSADTEVLELSGRPDVTLSEIRKALPYLPRLRKIVLCDCGFKNEVLADFDEELSDIRVVWDVLVGGRRTRTDEVYFTPNKWGLKLNDKNITDLKYCRDMICVDIGHARSVTNCEFVRYMPELKYLILADGNIQDLEPLRGLKKLEFLELFLTPVKDLSPLQDCTALKDLNLCYVYADPAPIQNMTWLRRLWWTGSWPARTLLSEKLPDTEKNFDSPSSTGGTWRQGELYYAMRDLIGMGYMIG